MRLLKGISDRYGGRRWFAAISSRVLPPTDRTMAWISRGRWTLSAAAAPTLLLTCTGRRSGQLRTTPLVYVPAGGGWAVVGTNFGKPHHPAWVHNLLADPNGTATVDGQVIPIRARRVTRAERAQLWPRFVAVYPGYADYADCLDRDAHMFVLEPTTPSLETPKRVAPRARHLDASPQRQAERDGRALA